MIRSPEELSKPIKEAVNRRSVMMSNILLAATIALHAVFNPALKGYQVMSLIALSLAIVLMVVLRLFELININARPRIYMTAFYIITFFSFAFVSEPASPYSFSIFLLVFISNLYYGSKGVLTTIGVFGAASVTKYIFLSSRTSMNYQDQAGIAVTFLVFVAVCVIYINIQKIFDWDRARLHDTIKESMVEEKRLRALVNNMTESVLVLDKEGIIRLYNAAALALFNTNNSLSDKPLDGFIKLEDEKGSIITTLDLMPKDTKPIVRNDVVIRYRADDTAAVSLVVTPIRSTFGQEKDEGGFVMTMRDITREKSLEEERDEFISVISHELRTPVTVAEAGVSNALLLVDKMPGNEKIKSSLKTAHDQSVFLANMLNDLTTFARAEKGTLELNLEEFDPREVLTRLRDDYRSAVEAKKMSIVCKEDPSTPLRMASNHLYIREILQNFVTNSIKYSDKGTITLSARAKGNGVLFSVADEGIGISTSDQKKVFEKFFRAEDYRTRSTNGTGLGLYIVKKLAKILNASFELHSEVGKGSTFSVFIPDMSSLLAAKQKAAQAPLPTTHQPSPPTVAITDPTPAQQPAPAATTTQAPTVAAPVAIPVQRT